MYLSIIKVFLIVVLQSSFIDEYMCLVLLFMKHGNGICGRQLLKWFPMIPGSHSLV